MKSSIRLDMRLDELLMVVPEAAAVFSAHGLGGLVSPEAIRGVAPFLSLETALKSHDISPEHFLPMLEACTPSPGAGAHTENSLPRIMSLMPCGLKMPFGRAMESFMAQLKADAFDCTLESNLNQEVSYYPYAAHLTHLDELPDALVSSDFNPFYHHRFYDRFIAPGHFTDVAMHPVNDHFRDAGICDPLKEYTVLCVNPLVIVADLEKTGSRPLPRRWEDLLDPVWERDITLRGNNHLFCHAVLLPLYREYGADGLGALAGNVADGLHPSQMVTTAGTGKSSALYVMPHFFARKIPAGRKIEIIWPEDGALASPVTLLTKTREASRVKPVTDYLTGLELARVFDGAAFPAPHVGMGGSIPAGCKLKWLGWDFIRENDMEAVNRKIDDIFLPLVREHIQP